MEQKTTKSKTFEADDNPTVYVSDTINHRFGPKAILGGDTYDAKKAIKELDWDDTHRTWDDELEAWTIDYDALDALEAKLEEHDMSLGGLAEDVLETCQWMADFDEHDWWAEQQIEIRVVYDHPRSDSLNEKTGIVSSADDTENWVQFKRDDGTVNRISGDSMIAPNSNYPYMGDIETVELTQNNK